VDNYFTIFVIPESEISVVVAFKVLQLKLCPKLVGNSEGRRTRRNHPWTDEST